MAQAQKIRNTVDGAKLVKVLHEDLVERASDLLPKLIEQIEETEGLEPQALTVGIKYKPGSEKSSPAFEIAAKMANNTRVTHHVTEFAESGPDGRGPVQLRMFVD